MEEWPAPPASQLIDKMGVGAVIFLGLESSPGSLVDSLPRSQAGEWAGCQLMAPLRVGVTLCWRAHL